MGFRPERLPNGEGIGLLTILKGLRVAIYKNYIGFPTNYQNHSREKWNFLYTKVCGQLSRGGSIIHGNSITIVNIS